MILPMSSCSEDDIESILALTSVIQQTSSFTRLLKFLLLAVSLLVSRQSRTRIISIVLFLPSCHKVVYALGLIYIAKSVFAVNHDPRGSIRPKFSMKTSLVRGRMNRVKKKEAKWSRLKGLSNTGWSFSPVAGQWSPICGLIPLASSNE